MQTGDNFYYTCCFPFLVITVRCATFPRLAVTGVFYELCQSVNEAFLTGVRFHENQWRIFHRDAVGVKAGDTEVSISSVIPEHLINFRVSS